MGQVPGKRITACERITGVTKGRGVSETIKGTLRGGPSPSRVPYFHIIGTGNRLTKTFTFNKTSMRTRLLERSNIRMMRKGISLAGCRVSSRVRRWSDAISFKGSDMWCLQIVTIHGMLQATSLCDTGDEGRCVVVISLLGTGGS